MTILSKVGSCRRDLKCCSAELQALREASQASGWSIIMVKIKLDNDPDQQHDDHNDDGDEPNYVVEVAKNLEKYQTLQTRSPFGSQQNLAGPGQHSRFDSSTYLFCSTFRHARHCRCNCCAPHHNCSHVFIFSGSGTVQGTLNGALKRESLGCIWGRYMHLDMTAGFIYWLTMLEHWSFNLLKWIVPGVVQSTWSVPAHSWKDTH